jgi:hypothetical protein
LFRPVALTAVGLLTLAALVGVSSPATASRVARSAGAGNATATVVNFREAAGSPDATTAAPISPGLAEFQRRRQSLLPARSAAENGRAVTGTTKPVVAADAVVTPNTAPHISSNFDGINQNVGCSFCTVPDATAASSLSQIVEVTNRFIQVHNRTGVIQCGGGVTLNRLLRSSDELIEPRLQFDMVNNRFSLVVMIIPPNSAATPAIYAAASTTADACGTWNTFRLTFNGGPFPAGTSLNFPILGQDRTALLMSTRNFTPSGAESFTVFGLSKSTVYNGGQLSFATFNTASQVAPVTNAGQPMVSSPFSYFLGSVPGTGYRLYRLSNSGGPGATLTLQSTIGGVFTAPTRLARQPGAIGLDASQGDILSTPYYDGTSIWFAHAVDLAGFPAVRYGAVNVSTNTVQLGIAYHSGTSDDFNPSIAVGLSPAGPVVYLNWVFTDVPVGTGVSLIVDGLSAGQQITGLIGTGNVYLFGATSDNRTSLFGEYSSASIDPGAANGGCAVTAQEYFGADGTWHTRLARMGVC